MRCTVLLLVAVVAAACGGESPAAPTPPPPPPPPPPPAAALESTGPWSFTNCNLRTKYPCHISSALENVGEGCATDTTAILRLYDEDDAEIGTPLQMGAVGGGVLVDALIRPGEVLQLISVNPGIDRYLYERLRFTRLFPTWMNVRC